MTLRGVILFIFVASSGFCQIKPSIYLQKNISGTTHRLHIISADTDSAEIRVTNKYGMSVKGLNAGDFLVIGSTDTAEILSCEEISTMVTSDLAVSFIFDNSGSMFSAYDSLTTYADRFIDSLPDGFIANALTFDEIDRNANAELSRRGTMYIACSGFSPERQMLKNFWHSYDSIRTKYTPLNDAMLSALEHVHERKRKTKDERNDIIILVTDGADNASKTTLSTLQELLTALKVTLFTISYSNEPNNKLDWLARKTDGKHFNSYNLHDLRDILDGIRKNITTGYKLTYRFPFRGASSPK